VPRRPILALLAGACLAQAVLSAAPASSSIRGISTTESASPINDQGASFNYRSNITSVTPHAPGLSVQVLEFADRLLLTNHTGRTVTIYGYQGEPYARVLADGTAEQNVRSPATYLNASFYGNVSVPPSANPSAPPRWALVDRVGQFEWHDHRIHWASPLLPSQVKDRGKRTLIFAWKVPIEVGASRGAIAGELFWTPESSKAPVAAVVAGALIVLAGLAFVVFVRRRRRAKATIEEDGETAARRGDSTAKEAW
jgi:hypothetical protein